METFHKFLSEFCVSPTIHVSWPNLAKIGRCEVAEKSSGIAHRKKTRSGHFLPPPISPHLPDRAQNFVNVVDPGPVNVYRLWSGSDAVCRTYSGKSQKSQYNIDFQPIQQEVWPPGSADTVWPCSPASNDAGTAFRFPDLEEAEVIRTDDVRL